MLAQHVRKYAADYAIQVARGGHDVVSYINLGEGEFMRRVGSTLKAGYVLTHTEQHHSFGHDLVGEIWELAL